MATNLTFPVEDGSRFSIDGNDESSSPEDIAAFLGDIEVAQARSAEALQADTTPSIISTLISVGKSGGDSTTITLTDPAPDEVNAHAQVQTHLSEISQLTNLIHHVILTSCSVLHAIVAADPATRNEPIQCSSRRVVRIWHAQICTFMLLYNETHAVDTIAMRAANGRFGSHLLARMRQMIEVQMRIDNGLPQEDLSPIRETSLWRDVLKAQLSTLQLWCDNWRRASPSTHSAYLEPIEENEGEHDGISHEEIARFMACGHFMENRTDLP
jgi:hypothetical protein